MIEIWAEQSMIFVSDIQCLNHLIYSISHCNKRHTDWYCKCSRYVIYVFCLVILITHKFTPANVKLVTEQKKLDNLVQALGENRFSLHKPYMKGTHITILQEIENKFQSVNSPSVIWIRGSPGIGKSALVASVVAQLWAQDCYVISFRFDCT